MFGGSPADLRPVRPTKLTPKDFRHRPKLCDQSLLERSCAAAWAFERFLKLAVARHVAHGVARHRWRGGDAAPLGGELGDAHSLGACRACKIQMVCLLPRRMPCMSRCAA